MPADGSGPLNDSAESGVRTDEADKRASPGKAMDIDIGKVAVVGVLRAGSFGRVAAIMSRCALKGGLDRRVFVRVRCIVCDARPGCKREISIKSSE